MNLASMLLAAASTRPDAIALRVDEHGVTYAQLSAHVATVADRLVAEGVVPGDRVALLAGNGELFVAGYLATLAVGAVAVPLNPQAPDAELARELAVVEPRIAVTDAGPRAVVDAAGIATLTPDSSPAPPAATPDGLTFLERADDDLAVLLFTAGTAGAPKAAMLTHGNLASNVAQVQDHPGLRVHADDVALGVLPLFHVFGLNVVLGTTLAAGGTTVLVPEFRAVDTAAALARAAGTIVAGVPSMFSAWLDAADALTDDAFATVRLAVSGAAPLPVEVAERFRERFGVVVHEGYGLTEASPIVTTSAVDTALRAGSIGPPLPGVEVRLVDADGEDARPGDAGEIWVQGPNVFAGYWRDDEATRRVLGPDGWLHTGDVAVADDDGYLSLVDRKKDLVIVSGFNVYPAEVEDVLREHPDVAEAAVVGVPDARTGEALVAFVTPAPACHPDPNVLAAFVGERLARYKVPASVRVVDALPRNRLGKLLRRELLES